MPYVLGLYSGHDANLALVGEGKLWHFEVERFTRIKHDYKPADGFAEKLLDFAGVNRDDVIAFAECGWSVPCRKAAAPSGPWLSMNEVRTGISTFLGSERPIFSFPHHTAHAAYAFYTSPFEEARIIAMDGGGDPVLNAATPAAVDTVTCCGRHAFGASTSEHWKCAHLPWQRIGERWRHASVRYCGREWAEGTVMAMAGIPIERWGETGPPLEAWSEIRHLQDLTTETFHRIFNNTWKLAAPMPLVLAGGVALNGPAVYSLMKRDDVDGIHVPPAVNDGGLAIGAALLALHQELKVPRVRYSAEAVAFAGWSEPELEGEPQIDRVVEALSQGKMVGLAYGRAESGPRSLGHRSILASASPVDGRTSMRDKLNWLKGRQAFRPVAPSVLESAADWYFDTIDLGAYSFMTVVAHANEHAESAVPEAVHYDGSARPQLVPDGKGPFAAILGRSHSIVLNTSMNGPGQPIVNTAAEAHLFFEQHPDLDAMAIGSEWLSR